jgi:outer membrane protein assembly factor BamB
MLQSAAQPAGALICVNTEGKPMWPAFMVPDSVLMKPAVDAKHVWFGSRDGSLYCLNRRDGNLAWKKELGSPIVTAPTLAGCSTCGHSSTLYVAASNGKVLCLDPDNGQEYWAYEMPQQLKPELLSSPRLFVGNSNRHLYFGAVHTIDGSSTGALYCLEDRLHAHSAKAAGAE